MSYMQVIPFVQLYFGSDQVDSAPAPIPPGDGDLLDHLVEAGVFFYARWNPKLTEIRFWTTTVDGLEIAWADLHRKATNDEFDVVIHNLLTETHVALHPEHAVPFSHDGKSA